MKDQKQIRKCQQRTIYQSKGNKYLEQELANVLGKGLENKYFRLQAKKVKSKILCKCFIGFKFSVFTSKPIARISFFFNHLKTRHFLACRSYKSRQRAVFGPKAVVCPLLAQSTIGDGNTLSALSPISGY